jgi:hypothetical protein
LVLLTRSDLTYHWIVYMKHTWKPHSKNIWKRQGRRFIVRCLWTGERLIAFYAPAQDNTTQKRNWVYIEATERGSNPWFLCSSISRWLWRSIAQNCKCYGPVPYVSVALRCLSQQGLHVSCVAVKHQLPLAFCHAAQQSLPNRGLQVDYQRVLIWVSVEQIGDAWTEGSIFRHTGGKDVTATEANCLDFRCHTVFVVFYISCIIYFAALYYIFLEGVNNEATSSLIIDELWEQSPFL